MCCTCTESKLSVGSPVIQDNLVATLTNWGPSYRIALNLKISSFDGENLQRGRWAELLRLTSTDNNCCNIGDRIPAIFTNVNGFIQVATQIDNKGNRWKNINLDENVWYNLEILQSVQNSKVVL